MYSCKERYSCKETQEKSLKDTLLEEINEAIKNGTFYNWRFLLENIIEIQEGEDVNDECYDSESFYEVYRKNQESFIKILEFGFILNEKSYIGSVDVVYILNLNKNTFEEYDRPGFCISSINLL